MNRELVCVNGRTYRSSCSSLSSGGQKTAKVQKKITGVGDKSAALDEPSCMVTLTPSQLAAQARAKRAAGEEPDGANVDDDDLGSGRWADDGAAVLSEDTVNDAALAAALEDEEEDPYVVRGPRTVFPSGTFDFSIKDGLQCMSLHQPYASLLVYGIKKAEGRTWSTPHRGRLWIASTVQEPSQEDIHAIEASYESHYGTAIEFPDSYPCGVLLGCVDVDACMPQEEYRRIIPVEDQEDNESPFIFVCSNAVHLTLPLAISGQHKIYTMTKELHKNAVNQLK